MEPHLGTTGAKRTSHKEYNLRDLCLKVHGANPDCYDADQLRDLLIVAIKKEQGYIETAIEHAASNTVFAYFKPKASASRKEDAKKKTAEKVKQATSSATTELKKHIRREAIKLLELKMPNGKLARDCTGPQFRTFGAGYVRIADRIGRKKAGEVLSEREYRALMKA